MSRARGADMPSGKRKYRQVFGARKEFPDVECVTARYNPFFFLMRGRLFPTTPCENKKLAVPTGPAAVREERRGPLDVQEGIRKGGIIMAHGRAEVVDGVGRVTTSGSSGRDFVDFRSRVSWSVVIS